MIKANNHELDLTFYDYFMSQGCTTPERFNKVVIQLVHSINETIADYCNDNYISINESPVVTVLIFSAEGLF